MLERSNCREPHTFLDSCGLRSHISPRLNELRPRGASSGTQEATTSTVFNRFSSVSAQQPGISCDTTFNGNNFSAVNGGSGSFIVPPPPPFFFAGGPPCFQWPPHVSPESWTAPPNVPWIPPPPISPNAAGTAQNNNNNSSDNINCFASTRWPTPQDIPLPSTFPFPPSLLSPFPPLPSDADLSRLPPPPPPPWFAPPQACWPQQRHVEQCQGTDASSGADDDSAAEPPPRRGKVRAAADFRGTTQQPSLSAQEEHHLRSIAQNAKKKLQRTLSRSQSIDSLQNSACLWQNTLRNVSPRRGHCLGRGTAPSARQCSSTNGTRRATVVGVPTLKKLPHQQSKKNYFTAARSLKGELPSLEDAINKPLSLRGRRPATDSHSENFNSSRQYRSTSQKEKKNKESDHKRSLQTNGSIENFTRRDTDRDARVSEYLKGIEDLYKRLRSSYQDFQRDPLKFLNNVSALKSAAPAKASGPTRSQRESLDATTITKKKEQEECEKGRQLQPKEFPMLSQESQRIREELLRLEMQWQRLEELKRSSTGERGAAPVEILPRNAHSAAYLRRHPGTTEGANAVSAGILPSREATLACSRSSTPRSAGDQAMGAFLDNTHLGQGNQNVADMNGRGEFTREHLLGLVRERKALFG